MYYQIWCYGVIIYWGDFMSYFLKKTVNKKGTYLQIYESFYEPERGHTAHRSYKAIGYVTNKLISEETPEKMLGYFPLKNINDKLNVKRYIDLMQSITSFKFNVYSLISALVYSRAVMPCSKIKTFEEVIPKLMVDCDFSLNQLYSGLEYIGLEYEKIIEIYNHQIQQLYPFDTSTSYFDCTNFYFEIDREDDFRKKGPSKENIKEPIVGMGLLLDANQIPVGMKLYPGNENEKPVIHNIIDELKNRNNIKGKTIQVADKGLNCADKFTEKRVVTYNFCNC
jgi:hypothetical protein